MSVIGQEPKKKIIELFERHVSSGKVAFFGAAGIEFVLGKREGVYMYDVDGKRLAEQRRHRHPEPGRYRRFVPGRRLLHRRRHGRRSGRPQQ